MSTPDILNETQAMEELARLMRRLEKARALADQTRNDSPEQAASAADIVMKLQLKADLIMRTWNITWSDPTDNRADDQGLFENGRVVIGAEGHHLHWRRRLALGIASANSCRGIVLGSTFEVGVVGRRANIAIVDYMFNYLVGQISQLAHSGWDKVWADYLKIKREYKRANAKYYGTKPNGSAWRDAFVQGAVDTILEKLEASRDQFIKADQNMYAMVKADDALLKDAFMMYFPNQRSINLSKGRGAAGYNEGKDAGRGINIHRPISEGGVPGKLKGTLLLGDGK